MSPRMARSTSPSAPLPLVLLLLLGLLPSLAAAQVRDWAMPYDSGGPDTLGCNLCDPSFGGFVPPSVLRTHTVAADAAGNSWIAGGTSNATNTDIVTVQHDIGGNERWAVAYDGGDEDSATAVAVDGAGNVYVAGTTWRTTSGFDLQPHALLLKYDPAGTLLWERVYRRGVWSQGLALAVDAAGTSYLAVQNYNPDDYVYAELLKTSPSGAAQGSDTSFFGFDAEEQGPTAVVLDAAGTAYMAGWIYKPSAPDRTDYFVSRFGGWAARWDSGGQDVAYDLATDSSGRLFVTGNRGTAAFGPAGAPLWSAPFSGVPHAVVAGDGGVWVAGTEAQSFRTTRYDAATGAPSWSTVSGGPGADAAFALRRVGSVVYVAGTSSNGTDDDALIVGLEAATGAEIWQDRYDGGGSERIAALAATGNGLWIAGTADGDLLALRYELAPAGPALSGLTLTPGSFPGGCKSSTGRVALDGPAPAGGTVVSLASTNPVAVLPATVIVPAGKTSAAFSITAPAVASPQVGTVTATAGGQGRSATLKVRPIGVLSLVLTPNPVTGPSRVDGSVLLECPAAPGPVTIQLASSDPAVARPDVSTLTIPAGVTTGRFTVSTADISATRWVNLKAVASGVSRTVRLEVR